ncbi:MAG: exopolysaccharide Pel transporter PelG [Rectinemataceae bacterium]
MIQSVTAGAFIVAGPSIAAAVGLGFLSRFLVANLAVDSSRFMAVIIVNYAASLILLGAPLYIFSRLVSDLLYLRLKREAVGLYIKYVLVAMAVTALIAIPFAGLLTPVAGPPVMFRAGAVLLFSGISALWFAMLIASLLQWYGRVLAAYAGGIVVGSFLAWLCARSWGDAGALLGYAIGQCLTAFTLTVLACRAHRPRFALTKAQTQNLADWKKLALLGAAGLGYYASFWVDKILFWATRGTLVEGTPFKLYPPYDYAGFIANLSIVPGLVYYIISLEPILHSRIMRLVDGIGHLPRHRITRLRYTLTHDISAELRSLILVQGAFAVATLFLIPLISKDPGEPKTDNVYLAIAIVATSLQFIAASIANILFYFQRYGRVLAAFCVYIVVDLLASLPAAFNHELPTGMGFALGGLVAILILALGLRDALAYVDKNIFSNV